MWQLFAPDTDRNLGEPRHSAGGHSTVVIANPIDQTSSARHVSNWQRCFWQTIGYGARVERAGGLLTAWLMWDHLAAHLWPSMVPPHCLSGTLKIRVTKYSGTPLSSADGGGILTGARILELHCDNRRILALTRNGESLVSSVKQDLSGIAEWVARTDEAIAGIYGITLLGAAASRFGFHRRDLPLSIRVRADRLFMNGLLALYNQAGLERLNRGRTLNATLQEIWMSRTELLSRYLK